MDKFRGYILILVIILSGFITIPRCVDYLNDRSAETGEVGELVTGQYVDGKNNYSITYNLDGGSAVNPETYNLFTETFTLNNPTKLGYEFLGWTNETLTEPKLTVTICKGSAGDIEFTANYLKYLDEPQISFDETNTTCIKWQAVENATGYVINVNGNEIKLQDTFWKLKAGFLKVGKNTFKVRAICETENKAFDGPYSNTLEYFVSEGIESPTLSITNNVITFNKVNNAYEYVLVVGNSQMSSHFYNVENNIVSLEIYKDDVIESLFYSQDNLSYYNSNLHSVPVSIIAFPKFSELVAPGISNTVNFQYQEFYKINALNVQASYQTVGEIENEGLVLDNNQYLCLLLSDLTEDLFNNTLVQYAFTIEVSLNNEIVQASSFKRGVWGVFYTKLNDLENSTIYTVTLKFKNKFHDNYMVEYIETFNFVLDSTQVWCLSF